MHVARTFRMSAAVVATALTVSALGTAAAEARPTRPGGITGLTASASATSVSTSLTKYAVTSSWDATPKATSYKVTLTEGATTLASGSVTSPSWRPTVRTTPGRATLTVRALVAQRQGKPSSVTVYLDDVNAPVGAFSATSSNATGDAVITQNSLSDDSGAAAVTRTVDWGDGTGLQTWTAGTTTIDHSYTLTPAEEVRFAATVTLTDAAGNTVTVDVVPAPVFNDHTAPTGSFTVAPTSAWADLTSVTITQGSVSDDRTPAAAIVRTVDWGDGSALEAWTSGTTISHVYSQAGSHTPTVTITDEANNSASIATSAVVVTADTVAPHVTITKARPRHSVTAWRTLRGRATDTGGTGVKAVTVKAVEKRHGAWYGYNAKTHTWLKAATKAKAFKRAVAFTRTTDARHRWTATLRGLAKGSLVVKASATDLVGNRSAAVTRKALLTTR